MPKIAELKKAKLQPYKGADLDWNNFRFKDKQREQIRKQTLADGPKEKLGDPKKRKTTIAWSEKLEHKANKDVKRSRKEAKREHERALQKTDEQKEYEAETARMVQKMRQQQARKLDKEDVFEGFG